MQRRLGRGLDYLISGQSRNAVNDEVVQLEVKEVRSNPFQPRRMFTEDELEELSNSILEHGILQPVVVRRTGTGFELIAGERRVRACQRIGRERIPAVVRAATDDEMLELALVENVQRQDLNPIETAGAYRAFIDRLGLTQEEASHRLGKSRPAVANMLRLLELPDEIQEMVSSGDLSSGHGRALLGVEDPALRMELARCVKAKGLSVRDLERAARRAKAPATEKPAADAQASESVSAYYDDLGNRLQQTLGTRVRMQPQGEKGRIVIEYFSHAELERLLSVLLPD